MPHRSSRRSFLQFAGLGAAAIGIGSSVRGDEQKKIQGFEEPAAQGQSQQGVAAGL